MIKFTSDVNYSSNFVHFKSAYLIKKFKSCHSDLEFGHNCCGGRGICILNMSQTEINKIKNEFLNTIKEKKKIIYNLKGSCGICLEEDINIDKTNCQHNFCYNCINKWKQRSNTCPICRQPLINGIST